VKLSISPSGRGYHVKFKTPLEFTDESCIHIREFLDDDPNRISVIYDGDKKIYRDVLFDVKIINGKVCKCIPLDVGKFISFNLKPKTSAFKQGMRLSIS
jgi:hypothetical protein